jgi:signal transduction histidine kinase
VMQARAAHLGGSLELHSICGQGTQVILRWPLVKKGKKG